MKILEAKGLVKYYGKGDSLVKAVDHSSFSVDKGEFVAVVGTSGSGKTTLLNLIGGLDYADEGQIIIEGQDISKMKADELTIFRRRKIGFIFQNYNLVTVLNAYKNIVMPVKLDGNKVDEAYIQRISTMLGIENKMKSYPSQLSGGQQQRVAIARALSAKPAIILADEPTGNLDRKNSQETMELLKFSNQQYQQTILLITHDEKIALMADRILTLEDGKIIRDEVVS